MNPLSFRRSRPALRRHALVVALLAAMFLSACGGADEDAEQATTLRMRAPRRRRRLRRRPPATRTPAPRTARRFASPSATPSSPARLHDNATARDLAAQLPLTLTFRDHNNVEKTAPLPRELSLDGAPEGHDPAAGDIGYWAPDGNLVLYYDDDAPFWNGIVRIGEFDDDADTIKRLPEGARVTIEPAR